VYDNGEPPRAGRPRGRLETMEPTGLSVLTALKSSLSVNSCV